MPFLQEQLSFLFFLQGYRTPGVSGFFKFLNFFDSDVYAILLTICIWLGLSAKWGTRLGFLILFDALLNYLLKMTLALPRPFVFDASLAMVPTSTQFGCPSGGAEMSFVLGCLAIYAWKSRWAWVIGSSYILLISFSRIFLGAHFPIDVIGGWLLGFGVFVSFVKSMSYIERFIASQPRRALILSLASLFVVALLFHSQATLLKFTGMASLLSIGLFYTPGGQTVLRKD